MVRLYRPRTEILDGKLDIFRGPARRFESLLLADCVDKRLSEGN
jgi:hypothetical protein